MARVSEYHRPETITEALTLLARPGVTSAPLAGGTALVPRLVAADNNVQAVVDLGRLDLKFIEREGEALRLGAMATLADVAGNPSCRSVAGGLLSRAAQLNAVSNVRNAATIGGLIVAGDPTSELLLALLVLEAEAVVQTAGEGAHSLPLDAWLHAPTDTLANGLLTEVRLLVPEERASAGLARLGRTPQDRPIVAAAAMVVRQGDLAARVALAMSGIAEAPLRLRKVERTLAGQLLNDEMLTTALAGLAERLEPPADFRGSAEYRRAMALILARRALLEAWTRAAEEVRQ
jgi:carbon-monoxide dehydrogenase medium subunit